MFLCNYPPLNLGHNSKVICILIKKRREREREREKKKRDGRGRNGQAKDTVGIVLVVVEPFHSHANIKCGLLHSKGHTCLNLLFNK